MLEVTRAKFLRRKKITFVFTASLDLFVGSLDLQDELDTFNWSDGGLRDGGGDSTSEEVLSEAHCVLFLLCGHYFRFFWVFLKFHTTSEFSTIECKRK